MRSEDRFYNRPSGPIPSYQVLLATPIPSAPRTALGEPWREIPASVGGVTTLTGLVLDRPGTYRFTVRCDNGAITGTSNPLWVREGKGLQPAEAVPARDATSSSSRGAGER